MNRIQTEIDKLKENGRFSQEKLYMHHGKTNVYEHSVHVAQASVWMAEHLNVRVSEEEMIRGALLHDYFLYDWHIPDETHRLHGFSHARKALENACSDYELTEKEQDIICHHMFPLNIEMPGSREAWIVCMTDKACSLYETFDGIFQRFKCCI